MDECKNNIIQKSNMYGRFEDINLKVHVILFTFDFRRYFLVCISRYDFRRVYWRYNYRAENVIGSQISKTLYVYWVYLVPMVLRKHTLYNIRYLSFEWICIYTSILWYELIKNNNILLKQECLPCVQVIDCWQFSDDTFFYLNLVSMYWEFPVVENHWG